MKKTLSILLLGLSCLICFSACGKQAQNEGNTETAPQSESFSVPTYAERNTPSVFRDEAFSSPKEENGETGFLPPLSAEALELSRGGDISTDSIHFTYDEAGQILTCDYSIRNRAIKTSYRYEEDGILISGFYQGTKVYQAKYYPTEGFDSALGYTMYDGFYFYGYSFAAR